jgi:fructoselysine and glucoselysine-specific PTS system IIA component
MGPKKRLMRKFLIATHGKFASGIKSSLDMIIGAQDNIFVLDAYTENNVPIQDHLDAILNEIEIGDELVVFTDIMGGSITNQIIQRINSGNAHIVSGVNLPLLIEVILSDPDEDLQKVLDDAVENAKTQIVYVSKLITKQTQND